MKYIIPALLCLLVIACVPDREAVQAKAVKAKAERVRLELERRHVAGQDVSALLAQARKAATLGKQGKIAEVNTVLDTIIGQLDALPPVEPVSGPFSANHRRVLIEGYNDHAMEPFLSRDGKTLFFNNSNAAGSNTNIHYATRIDDLTFRYRGEVGGINTGYLEGVPTLDRLGNFYCTSTREYPQTLKTVFTGRYRDGKVSGVYSVEGLSLKKHGWLNMDSEISADGQTLYTTHSRFAGKSYPVESNLFVAVKTGEEFAAHPRSDEIIGHLNSRHLEYAVGVSSNEKEIFYTRLNLDDGNYLFQILRATRMDKNQPFGKPEVLKGFTGLVEGPTLSPDGEKMYYHKKVDGLHRIFMARR